MISPVYALCRRCNDADLNESGADATDAARGPDRGEAVAKSRFQDRPGACKLIETAVSRGDRTMTPAPYGVPRQLIAARRRLIFHLTRFLHAKR
jgi:hypothetical protein